MHQAVGNFTLSTLTMRYPLHFEIDTANLFSIIMNTIPMRPIKIYRCEAAGDNTKLSIK